MYNPPPQPQQPQILPCCECGDQRVVTGCSTAYPIGTIPVALLSHFTLFRRYTRGSLSRGLHPFEEGARRSSHIL
jgi:hypothetical protein